MTGSPLGARSAAWEPRVRDSFARQALMTSLGATLDSVVPGQVTITMPYAPAFTQQHGFLHGGTVASVLDSACGYAGFSLMDDDSAVLTAEFKINFLAPAKGDHFRFEGRVIKPGRTLVLTEGRAFALSDTQTDRGETMIATMSCTLMAVRDRGLKG